MKIITHNKNSVLTKVVTYFVILFLFLLNLYLNYTYYTISKNVLLCNLNESHIITESQLIINTENKLLNLGQILRSKFSISM